MTYGINIKLVNMFDAENGNLTPKDLNTIINKLDNWWNILLVLYYIVISRANPISNVLLSYLWGGISSIHEYYFYKKKNSSCWQISMRTTIGLTLQVTALPGILSLFDWCFHKMLLSSSVPEHQEDGTAMEKHGAGVVHSAVKSLMNAIQSEHKEVNKNTVHWMILIA